MKLNIEITDNDFVVGKAAIRSLVAFLLHGIGELDEEVPTGTTVAVQPVSELTPEQKAARVAPVVTVTVPAPPAAPIVGKGNDPFPPPPPAPGMTSSDDDDGPPPSNVVTFPTPPAPPADTAAPSAVPAPPAPSAAAASAAASAGASSAAIVYDKAGMPWDERIHQKGKSIKKDGTWKLKKGCDVALVQAVTAELAARKSAGSLPPSTGNSLPVPPVPPANVPAVTSVPAPPAPSSVPVPPAPPVGSVGGGAIDPYRALIDKITAATREQKLTPAQVATACQGVGVPNLMQLNNMPNLIPAVSQAIDLLLLGLS